MADAGALDAAIAQFPDEVQANMRRWIAGEVPLAPDPDTVERVILKGDRTALAHSFGADLPFGTGGRRGSVLYGPGGMNDTTVAATVQGFINHLDAQAGSVVLANDSRRFSDFEGNFDYLGDHPLLGRTSRDFARLAAEIIAGNGLTVYMSDPDDPSATLTTPELAFAVPHIGAIGGVNISASHNPPDHNGIKVFMAAGEQPVPPLDQAMIETMSAASTVNRIDFEAARAAGLILPIPPQTDEAYMAQYERLFAECGLEPAGVPVVFTPLGGCADRTAFALLKRIGFDVHMPADQVNDGSFSSIPLRAPNPEIPLATAPAQEFAEQHGAEIVLSCDPDGDRVGADIRLADGSWTRFDGNQLATIIAYFLALDPQGPQRQGILIETLVTSRAIAKIAELSGNQCVDDLLVGFKYIADVIKSLDATGRYRDVTGRPQDLILGTEESHGFTLLPTVLDKDGAPPVMVLAGLHGRLAATGRTLLDYYIDLLRHIGAHDCGVRSIVLKGASGNARRDEIMTALRESTPDELGGQPVTQFADYWNETEFGPILSDTDRASRNVISFETQAFTVVVRPSGTEPKLKLYVLISGGDLAEGEPVDVIGALKAATAEVSSSVYRSLLKTLGVVVSDAALALPDLVDLDARVAFDTDVTPALKEALAAGVSSRAALDEIIRDKAALLTPGSDPVPAVGEALGILAAEPGFAPLRALL